jgi:predicted outer membrane repeat protein/parallel beta-helix repeat protein
MVIEDSKFINNRACMSLSHLSVVSQSSLSLSCGCNANLLTLLIPDFLGGGAVLFYGGSQIRISHCEFVDNLARYLEESTFLKSIDISFDLLDSRSGGAIGMTLFHSDCQWLIEHSLFFNNSANGGGALAVSRTAVGTLDNCTFMQNTAWGLDGGGAIRLHQASPTIKRTVFAYNNATRSSGGAVYSDSYAILMYSCQLHHNIAKSAGALLFWARTEDKNNNNNNNSSSGSGTILGSMRHRNHSEIRDTEFAHNSAIGDAGGAIQMPDSRLTIVTVFHNLTFTNNKAAIDGGAVYVGTVSLTMQSSVLHQNCASFGGAVYLGRDAKLGGVQLLLRTTITNCHIAHNTAELDGAGIYIASMHRCTVSNCSIEHNRALRRGGGLSETEAATFQLFNTTIAYNNATQYGGGMHFERSKAMLHSCTVRGNVAERGRGGGIYMNVGSEISANKLLIEYNVAIDGAGIRTGGDTTPKFVDCIVRNNTATSKGGGLSAGDIAVVEWHGGHIENNTALAGAGVILQDNSVMRMTSTRVAYNSALSLAAGVSVIDSSQAFLNNSLFIGNNGVMSGGIAAQDRTLVVVGSCSFMYNLGQSGGAINSDSSETFVIANSSFIGNSVNYDGGAVRLTGLAQVDVSDSIFIDNTAITEGAAFALRKSSKLSLTRALVQGNTAAYGAALYATHSAQVNITDTIIMYVYTTSTTHQHTHTHTHTHTLSLSLSLSLSPCLSWCNLFDTLITVDCL